MGAQSAQQTITTPSFDVAACYVESPNRILNDDSDDFIPCPREHDFHSISSPASNLRSLIDAIPSGSEAINNPLKYSRYPPDQVYAVTYVIDRFKIAPVVISAPRMLIDLLAGCCLNISSNNSKRQQLDEMLDEMLRQQPARRSINILGALITTGAILNL
ncbi:hypothetical protein RP20_CCG006616 [Aedes albopictus]|nr:hypothetical protein RP20_CCG006616 [Aedes albopictus]